MTIPIILLIVGGLLIWSGINKINPLDLVKGVLTGDK